MKYSLSTGRSWTRNMVTEVIAGSKVVQVEVVNDSLQRVIMQTENDRWQ